jgi:putative oxidoreductase
MTQQVQEKAGTPISTALNLISSAIALLDRIPASFYALMMRVAVFLVFFLSARTKVDGFMTINASTFYLFQNEYALPFVPYKLGAYVATFNEHVFSILILLGLATRFSSLVLLGMTMVIEIFVYPDAYVVHLTWASMLVYLIARGPGVVSLDHLIKRKLL